MIEAPLLRLGVLTAGLVLASCSGNDANNGMTPEQARIAARIEREIRLPVHSFPKRAYSQYFAWKSASKVDVTFLIQDFDPNGRRRVEAYCKGPHPADFPCGDQRLGRIGPGEKTWVRSRRDVPIVMGGGCLYVEATYNIHRNQFDEVRCNGPY